MSRTLTSVIDGLTVVDIRKSLGEIRKRWRDRSPETPFYLTDIIRDKRSIQEFSLSFQLGHHLKRHEKNGNRSTTSEDDDNSQQGQLTRTRKKPTSTRKQKQLEKLTKNSTKIEEYLT